jgi:signal transduction histidine kinase
MKTTAIPAADDHGVPGPTPGRWSAWTAWGLSGVGLAMFVATLWLGRVTRGVELPPGFEPGMRPTLLLALLLFVGAGGLLAAERPAHPVGWVLLATGLVWQIVGLAGQVRIATFAAGETSVLAAWVWHVLWLQGLVLIPLLFLLFPDGRLPSRRWRPIMWLFATTAGLLFAVMGLWPGRFPTTPVINPIGVEPLAGLLALLDTGAWFLGLVVIPASWAAPIVRYRRADRVQRYQLKWFLTAAVIVIGAWAVADTLQALGVAGFFFPLRTIPLALLPLATVVAVVRYRLYDIDLVISRTLLYTGLVGVVGLVYLGVLVGVGTIIGGREGVSVPLAVAATALAAVAFQPARQRLQRLANRLVYGQRASPYEVLASFTQRMTDAYPAGQAPAAMAEAVGEGLRLACCNVWLRVGDELHVAGRWPPQPSANPGPVAVRSPVDFDEVPDADRTYPVHHEGALLGVIGIRTRSGVHLADSEDRLLADLAAAAWLVLDNAQLVSELRTSRQRLVTAQDTQRRRIERDLHDGAQQRLLELAMTLQLARRQVDEAAQGPATQTIAAAELQLRTALAELRDLARGIHPAILTERGLQAALESIAERAPMPIVVTGDGIGRHTAALEATAYFVAAEAIANVIKHAGAGKATITLAVADGWLHLTVTDDGCGGADTTASGLRGLTDRVAALNGRFRVTSPRGQGTTVELALPSAS